MSCTCQGLQTTHVKVDGKRICGAVRFIAAFFIFSNNKGEGLGGEGHPIVAGRRSADDGKRLFERGTLY